MKGGGLRREWCRTLNRSVDRVEMLTSSGGQCDEENEVSVRGGKRGKRKRVSARAVGHRTRDGRPTISDQVRGRGKPSHGRDPFHSHSRGRVCACRWIGFGESEAKSSARKRTRARGIPKRLDRVHPAPGGRSGGGLTVETRVTVALDNERSTRRERSSRTVHS